MKNYPYKLVPPQDELPALGLIVLQADETVEGEFRQCFSPFECDLYVSRIPSSHEVTAETLAAMSNHMSGAANLFPDGRALDCVGYACTSGTSVLGIEMVDHLIRKGCKTSKTTNPVSALIAACKRRKIERLAFLSPYVEGVSAKLRSVLAENGITTPVFGSFDEAVEARVARITSNSILSASVDLVKTSAGKKEIDGLFLSCTNLKTIDIANRISQKIKLPVLSSNSVLAEEMRLLAGISTPIDA